MDFLNDPNALPWLIPAGPLLAFLIITLITNKSKLVPATDHHEYGGHHPDYEGMMVPVVHQWSRVISVAVGMIGVIAALLISWQTLANASQLHHLGEEVLASSIAWMDTGETAFHMGVLVDPATVIMLVMVPIAVLMIFIYSIGYMAHDPRQARFFALISLFAGAMLTLVVADNVLLLFVGWEIMGVCSYMLIGFWFEKESAYKAAIKAFTTTRIADVVMLLGIAYLYSITGTLSFREIMYSPETLDMLATTTPIIFGGWTVSAASIIGIFLIIGTVGKSAQFPLHVWLPDAMEGPTPVSAMIHAAAMVSAGIFSLIRLYPLFAAGGRPAPRHNDRAVGIHGGGGRVYGAARGDDGGGAERCESGAGLLDDFTTWLHDGGAGHGRLYRGRLPSHHARLLQGAAIHGGRLGHSWHGAWRASCS